MVSKRGNSNLSKCDIGQCFCIVFIPCLWCTLVYFGVLWCTLVYFGILWCTLVYFDVLCYLAPVRLNVDVIYSQ